MNPLVELRSHGQSFWYDNIRRSLLRNGTIQELIERDGLRGMTSNPSIFDKAIGGSDDYDDQIADLAAAGRDPVAIYEALALDDIRAACDMFHQVYEEALGGDGYVSLEVAPTLARKTTETVLEARRLFSMVNRPNLMIKVPATPEGVPAIRQLIGEGINVNITLMFSMKHYEAVARAYIDGLEHLVGQGGDPSRVGSVASFFVSRVDTAADRLLDASNEPEAKSLLGKTAIANSKLVYQRFKEIFYGEAFKPLRDAGAPVQRLLWASTSTKNPDYPDTLYVDELIGPETVNTMPPATIDAFRDHGKVANTLEQDLDAARAVVDGVGALGLDLEALTEQLQVDGVKAFADSFAQLLVSLDGKIGELL